MSSLWLKSELTPVGRGFPYLIPLWDGKICRLCPRRGEEEEPEEKRSLGRRERKLRGKEEEEERRCFWRRTSEKTQEGAAGRAAQVRAGLSAQLSHLSTLLCVSPTRWRGTARDGAARGLEITPWQGPGAPGRALRRGTGALRVSARARGSKGIARGTRRQSHPVASASNSSLLWAVSNSSHTVFPREGSTTLPLPATRDSPELSDSLLAGADSLSPPDPLTLGPPALLFAIKSCFLSCDRVCHKTFWSGGCCSVMDPGGGVWAGPLSQHPSQWASGLSRGAVGGKPKPRVTREGGGWTEPVQVVWSKLGSSRLSSSRLPSTTSWRVLGFSQEQRRELRARARRRQGTVARKG